MTEVFDNDYARYQSSLRNHRCPKCDCETENEDLCDDCIDQLEAEAPDHETYLQQ
jgi:hypothetical protein